jgi:hypothetical protein
MSAELAGSYTGDYLHGRFHGKGVYVLKNNVKYEGNFNDGEFNGEGTLFVNKGCYKGIWKNGKLIEGGFIFEDGLEYSKINENNWNYCSKKDPRFYGEIKDGLGLTDPLKYPSANTNVDKLPKGAYDVIDGYFVSKTHTIYSYETNEQLRVPDEAEIEWIKANCRVGKH